MTNEILKFLLGEGPLEGVWFGEKHPTKRGMFWWRDNLRQCYTEQAQLQQHGVMQAEGSDVCKHENAVIRDGEFDYCMECCKQIPREGAAVASEGQEEANTCAGGWPCSKDCSCKLTTEIYKCEKRFNRA